MATPPLEGAAINWGKRLTTLSRAGVPVKKLRKVMPVVKEDLSRVKQGSQGMPTDEALLGMLSAIKGEPILQKKEDSGWSPVDILGDVSSDIADLTWRGIPALAKYVSDFDKHVMDTVEVMGKGGSPADTRWLKQHGYEPNKWTGNPLSDIAQGIRNLSRTPTLGIIPGVHTAAGLTTAQGRTDLAHHPVMTALDVLPVAAAASRTAGLAGKAGAVPGSVKEAALMARPGKVLYRSLPENLRKAVGSKTLAAVRRVGLDPESFPLSRNLDIEGRKALVEFDNKMKSSGIFEDVAKLPDNERIQLYEEAVYPDIHPNPSAAHAEMLPRVRAFFDELAVDNPRLLAITRETTTQPPTPPPAPFVKPTEILNKATGKMEPVGASVVDATGTPDELLGWEGDTPRSTPMSKAEMAEEDAVLAEFNKTKEPQMQRAEDRRATDVGGPAKVDRRSAKTRRVAEERRKQQVEQYAEERRLDDRRLNPEQRTRAERRLIEAAEKRKIADEAKAVAAEQAGNTELAAAYRETHTLDDLPPPRTPEEMAELERVLAEDTRTKPEPTPEAPPPVTTKTDYIYTSDSTVAKAHGALREAEERLLRVEKDANVRVKGETAIEIQRRMKAADKKARSVQVARKRVESAQRAVAKAQESAATGRGRPRTLDNTMTRLEKAVTNLRQKEAAAREAGEAITNPSNRNITSQQNKVAKARAQMETRRKNFEREFKNNPPANMQPMLERIIKERVEGRVRMQPWAVAPDGSPVAGGPGSLTADFVDDAVRQIERSDMKALMTPDEYEALRRDVMRSWQDMADQGYNPVWTHNVDVLDAGRAPSVRPLPSRNARVAQVKERAGDLTPKVEDLAVSMGRAAAEYIRERATMAFQEANLVPRNLKWSDISDFLHKEVDLMKAKGKIPRGVDEAGALQIALNKHFSEWDPRTPFQVQRTRITGTATVGDTKNYLPRHLANIVNDMTTPYQGSAFVRGAAATSKLYKTSIMAFSLKHMAHILFGGTVFLGLRGGFDEILNVGKAWRMAKEGKLPVEIGRHADFWESPDQMWQFASGHKLGKLYGQSLGRFANAKQRFDEFIINWQRADAFLSGKARAARRGADDAAATEAGLQHTYKTLVDIEGMNPMERNVLRQVMPFYAFMRHTLKYILSYPIDHPLRAAILARISDIEQKDWSSGLPEAMQTLFFMGQPDAEGNIHGVEMRQFNPFRDTGSYFTMAGFIKALHPAAQIPFSAAGVDKFTGSTELYPELEYDPQTGNLKAKRPPNSPWMIATTVVPEVGLIDYFGGITGEMRQLKARDPEAYKRRLYSMLFLPFEPKEVNKGKEAADIQSNILRIAQQDVSNATQTGNAQKLQQYPLIPYQGELIKPDTLGNVLQMIKKIRPDFAPKSVLPPVQLSKYGA